MNKAEFASHLENPILTPIFDQLWQLIEYAHVSIYRLDGSDLTLLAYRGPIPPGQASLFSFPLAKAGGARRVIADRAPLRIADAKDDSAVARSFQEASQDVPQATFDYIGSWIGLPLVGAGRVIGMLDLAHTERGYYTPEHVELAERFIESVSVSIENAMLVANLNQQAAEIRTLYALQQAIHSQLDAAAVLQLVADEALRLTSAQQAVILLPEREALRALVSIGKQSVLGDSDQVVVLLQGVVNAALERGVPVRIPDTRTAELTGATALPRLGIRSLMAVPLPSQERPLGALVVLNKQFGALGPADERLLTMLASGAAIALENSRLYRKEQHGRRVAEGKQAILASLGSNQPLSAILEQIIEQACGLLAGRAGAVYVFDPDSDRVALAALFELPAQFLNAGLELSDRPATAGAYIASLAGAGSGEPALAGLLCDAPPEPAAGASGAELRACIERRFRSALSVPLTIENRPVGMIELYADSSAAFDVELLPLAEDIGKHVALALDRARLAAKADELARLQERQRIAQTLHDSVVQNLFRVGLETAWCLQHANLDADMRHRVETVKRLVGRSSYELRSAIFALRNRKLGGGNSLVELLQDQVDEFAEQSHIPATLIASPNLPVVAVTVAEAIFRIVREALSNVAKHAAASAVVVSLRCDGGSITVIVQDNGVGLHAQASTLLDAEDGLHFGIDTMRRLAAQLGGAFSIGDNDDHGTMVRATFPVACLERSR